MSRHPKNWNYPLQNYNSKKFQSTIWLGPDGNMYRRTATRVLWIRGLGDPYSMVSCEFFTGTYTFFGPIKKLP